jgi:hypothetical protein
MTFKQQVIRDAIVANLTMPTCTLAKLIFEKQGGHLIWDNLEAVRSRIREARSAEFSNQRIIDIHKRSHQVALRLIKQFPNASTRCLGRMLEKECSHLKPGSGRSSIKMALKRLHMK